MTENLVKLRYRDQIRGKMAMAKSKSIVGAINSVASALSLSQPNRGRKLEREGVVCDSDELATIATPPCEGRGPPMSASPRPCWASKQFETALGSTIWAGRPGKHRPESSVGPWQSHPARLWDLPVR